MSYELNIYTRRPDGTALWLPFDLCEKMQIKEGDQLTVDQYSSPAICDLIERRADSQKIKKQ